MINPEEIKNKNLYELFYFKMKMMKKRFPLLTYYYKKMIVKYHQDQYHYRKRGNFQYRIFL